LRPTGQMLVSLCACGVCMSLRSNIYFTRPDLVENPAARLLAVNTS
jgi:hypothetical protein